MGDDLVVDDGGDFLGIDSFLRSGKERALKVLVSGTWPSSSEKGVIDVSEGVDELVVNAYVKSAETHLGSIPFVEGSDVSYQGIPVMVSAFGEFCSSLLSFLNTVEGGARKSHLLHQARLELLVYSGSVSSEDFDPEYFSRIAGLLIEEFPGLSLLNLDAPARQPSNDEILEELRRTRNFFPRKNVDGDVSKWIRVLKHAEDSLPVTGVGLLLGNVDALQPFEQVALDGLLPLFSLRDTYQTGDVESARFAEDLRLYSALYL